MLGRTVEELSRSLSSAELSEWMAFDRLEPIGGPAADLRAGIVASTVANVARGKRGKAFSPADFMPAQAREKKLAWQNIGLDQQARIVADRLRAWQAQRKQKKDKA
ncbi:MAG: hypothetical protein RIB41_10110 [Oceanibaculum nanhaiense]|uniref:phage tail assembly protein T n=1 Tax=Oceanibaculum nanhaiense TaxID=1909734 RepID=UPI0032EC5C96